MSAVNVHDVKVGLTCAGPYISRLLAWPIGSMARSMTCAKSSSAANTSKTDLLQVKMWKIIYQGVTLMLMMLEDDWEMREAGEAVKLLKPHSPPAQTAKHHTVKFSVNWPPVDCTSCSKGRLQIEFLEKFGILSQLREDKPAPLTI